MNILVLGAAGFIGINLTIELAKNEENHITLVDEKLEYFSPLQRFAFKNIVYRESTFEITTNFEELLKGYDVVYHLVSTVMPATSNFFITEDLQANVIVTSKMLEACVKCQVKKVVFISSGGTVYGKVADCPIRETNVTDPISSYGLQKITIEKLLYLYKYTSNLDFVIARLANPYGPYQRPNGKLGVVTTFIYNILNGKEITIYGDGTVIRDFIFIDDAIKAIVNLGTANCKNYIYNVGSGRGISIKDLLIIIQEKLGIEAKVNYQSGRAVDVPCNFLDIARYEKEFGKLETVCLRDGIIKTAEFFRSKNEE